MRHVVCRSDISGVSIGDRGGFRSGGCRNINGIIIDGSYCCRSGGRGGGIRGDPQVAGKSVSCGNGGCRGGIIILVLMMGVAAEGVIYTALSAVAAVLQKSLVQVKFVRQCLLYWYMWRSLL